MTRQKTAMMLMAGLLCLHALPAQAVIILKKGQSEPIRGYLLDAREAQVRIQVVPGGEEQTIQRSDIEEMIVAVEPLRLASLSPDNPTAYRDYAEELADKRKDPDAHRTAIRLYLLAAYLQPQELGPSCLLGMTVLARSPLEERRFRAMAYLLDREHDRTLLKSPVTPSAPAAGLTDSERDQLRRLLRRIRTQRTTEAQPQLNNPQVQAALAKVESFVRAQELTEAAARDSDLPPKLLRQIVALEVLLYDTPAARTELETGGAEPWSETLARGTPQPVTLLTLETITEFDPRQCYFRDNRWVGTDPRTAGAATR